MFITLWSVSVELNVMTMNETRREDSYVSVKQSRLLHIVWKCHFTPNLELKDFIQEKFKKR